MNQHKKRAYLVVLLLMVCAVLLGSCIHPIPGDFHTTALDTTLPAPEELDATTPVEIIPETTTPQETTTQKPIETTPEVTTPAETTTEQETTTQPPEPPVQPQKKIKIYIDQGHNPFLPKQNPNDPNRGWNTGASNEALGLYEQDITYDFGIRLAQLLEADGRFEVRLSRPTAETILGTDNDSALDYRVKDAAEWGADYFISLHTNSYTNSSVSGIEVYTANGDDEGYSLGYEILNELVKSTNLRNRDMRNGSELRVLKNAKMPAVLVEMGYLSNENDAILLRDSSELFVQGLYNGILNYFNSLEENTITE